MGSGFVPFRVGHVHAPRSFCGILQCSVGQLTRRKWTTNTKSINVCKIFVYFQRQISPKDYFPK